MPKAREGDSKREREGESESADNLSLSIARRHHQKTKQSSALVVVGFRTAAAKKYCVFRSN